MDNIDELRELLAKAGDVINEECDFVILATWKGNPDGKAACFTNVDDREAVALMRNCPKAAGSAQAVANQKPYSN